MIKKNVQKMLILVVFWGLCAGLALPAAALELHEAIKEGNTDRVIELIMDGIDPELRDDNGFTALHVAANRGQLGIVDLLLLMGADVNARDNGGWTPLHDAAQNDHDEIAEQLILFGADVDAANLLGETPLHEAAENGSSAAAIILLKNGADLNAREQSNQWSPLLYAYYFGHQQVASTLVAAGADEDVQDSEGMAPLHIVEEKQYPEKSDAESTPEVS